MVIAAAAQVMWLFWLFLALIIIEAVILLILSVKNTNINAKNAARCLTHM